MASRLRLSCVLAALAVAPGCVHVAPYQREMLARRDMQLGSGAQLAAGEEHADAYREGSSGGATVKAGGCGCN